MKIITILVGDIYSFPPALSLLNAFEHLKINSVLITTKSKKDLSAEYKNTIVDTLDIDYENILSPLKKLMLIPKISKKLWEKIDFYYTDDTILWIITDVTIKFLGNKITEKKYVLHLMELSEKIYYYHKLKFLTMDEEKIGNSALAVVVPEYNRAQITKAWWSLDKLPFILPNKPLINYEINRYSNVEDLKAREIISKLCNKKIILYQGIMSPERPLDMFIKAVDEYKGKYAFVVMSSGEDIYSNCGSENYYFIPFVTPPKHLQITSNAFIGVLSYVPTKGTGYSMLNSLYCAPNKTFEYAMFGIPMIGNNIPGLKFLFETEGNGECFENFTKEDICNAIDKIERDYTRYSDNSMHYYKKNDYEEMVNNILNRINEENI
ncbi:MAG: hypothetical protein ACLRT4_14380 [Thomasclavelia sp.]